MRVYQSGQMIPMERVTWGIMCSPRTLVTDEDPSVDFPPCVKRSAREAPLRIAKALGASKKLIARLRKSLSLNATAHGGDGRSLP